MLNSERYPKKENDILFINTKKSYNILIVDGKIYD